MEKLMGTINDLGQMCQSVKFHGGEGNAFLGQFRGDYNVVKMVPDELKNDCGEHFKRAAPGGGTLSAKPQYAVILH